MHQNHGHASKSAQIAILGLGGRVWEVSIEQKQGSTLNLAQIAIRGHGGGVWQASLQQKTKKCIEIFTNPPRPLV